MNIYQITIFFTVYAFAGWLIEGGYRFIRKRKLVNIGLLRGPFLPIYGIGAVFIIAINSFIYSQNIILQIFIYGIVLSAIEFTMGMISSKMFNIALWDYSKNRFNIKGKICLSYSIVWTVMSLFFVLFIHPAVNKAVSQISNEILLISSAVLAFYFVIDFIFSTISLRSFSKKIANPNLHKSKGIEAFRPFKRLLKSYPHLEKYL